MSFESQVMSEDKKIVCRVCLRFEMNGRKSLSLFEIHNGSLLSEKINLFTSFKIKENDGFPDKICPDCLMELEAAVHFREKCEISNQILHSVNSIKVEIPASIKDEETAEYFDDSSLIDNPILHKESLDNSEEEPKRKSRAIDLKLICHDCGGNFKSKCKLKVHWKKMHMAAQLLCEMCKRQFKTFKAFNMHKKKGMRVCAAAGEMRIEGIGKSRVFHCKFCEYKTREIKNAKAHMVTHSGERPFQCNICFKNFTQLSSLQGHKEGVHQEYKVETTCQYCGKYIQGRSKIYKHALTHCDKKIQCAHCNKLFKTRQSLKVHMLRHSNKKSFTCEICAASFYTIPELYNHKKNQHSSFGSNACDICGYVNKTYSASTRHKRKHTSTNFCCQLCGKFLNSEEEFTEHKKFHYGKKNPCPLCERTYNCRKSLLKHLSKKHQSIISQEPIVIKKEILKIV